MAIKNKATDTIRYLIHDWIINCRDTFTTGDIVESINKGDHYDLSGIDVIKSVSNELLRLDRSTMIKCIDLVQRSDQGRPSKLYEKAYCDDTLYTIKLFGISAYRVIYKCGEIDVLSNGNLHKVLSNSGIKRQDVAEMVFAHHMQKVRNSG